MFERLIRFAIEQRIVVMIAVLIMAGIGVYSYQKLPIDAVPDITNVQVQVNTAASVTLRWKPNSELPFQLKRQWLACRAFSRLVPFSLWTISVTSF